MHNRHNCTSDPDTMQKRSTPPCTTIPTALLLEACFTYCVLSYFSSPEAAWTHLSPIVSGLPGDFSSQGYFFYSNLQHRQIHFNLYPNFIPIHCLISKFIPTFGVLYNLGLASVLPSLIGRGIIPATFTS